MKCSLCNNNKSILVFANKTREFYQCEYCDLIFVPSQFQVPIEKEKARYDTHQNDLENPGYQLFLQRLINPLLPYLNTSMKGLDFGSGPTPALQKLLQNAGFNMEIYDPFYANEPSLLDQSYDFITSTEVVEHFSEPSRTWQVLANIVNANGYLAVMTQLHDEATNFANWWYKNDFTHVAFYSRRTLNWICQHFQFAIIYISKDVIIFKKELI